MAFCKLLDCQWLARLPRAGWAKGVEAMLPDRRDVPFKPSELHVLTALTHRPYGFRRQGRRKPACEAMLLS